MVRALLCVMLLLVVVAGCASSREPYMLPLNDEASMAEGGAWAASSMYIRKPMPDRRDSKPWQFYYKHCDTNGQEVYFSKTSYDCSGPSY